MIRWIRSQVSVWLRVVHVFPGLVKHIISLVKSNLYYRLATRLHSFLVDMVLGNCAFLIGPIVGWIRDITQSYVICFHSLTFIMCLCAVPWFIEIALLQICHKKRKN